MGMHVDLCSDCVCVRMYANAFFLYQVRFIAMSDAKMWVCELVLEQQGFHDHLSAL